jgi:hypothetical protein
MISYSLTNEIEKKETFERRKVKNGKVGLLRKDAPAPGKNDTNSTSGPLILNSIGRKVFVTNVSEIIVNHTGPYEVTRCDQVISFKAQYIPDMDEYRQRVDGWFTLTAHYTNLFKDNNADHLLKSILMSQSGIAPQHVRGTKSCILVHDGGNSRDNDITLCMPDKNAENNILEVFKTFLECRGGKDLTKAGENKLAVAQMILTCAGGSGKYVDPNILLKKLKAQKHNTAILKQATGFFHPGRDDVPGTPEPVEPVPGTNGMRGPLPALAPGMK